MIDTTLRPSPSCAKHLWEQWSKTPVALDYRMQFQDPRSWTSQDSNEQWKMVPWLFRVYVWDEIPPSYVRIFSKTLEGHLLNNQIYISIYIYIYTHNGKYPPSPKKTTQHLNMDSWNTIVSSWDPAGPIFRGYSLLQLLDDRRRRPSKYLLGKTTYLTWSHCAGGCSLRFFFPKGISSVFFLGGKRYLTWKGPQVIAILDKGSSQTSTAGLPSF